MSYELLDSKLIYNGRVFSVMQDTILLPDGNKGIRDIVCNNNDVSAVLPIDKDGNLILVRQYRHPMRKEVLEIPAGRMEKGEDPVDCAKRELEEEIGYKADKLEFITLSNSSVGFSTEKIYIYLANNLIKGKTNFDEEEFITIEKYTLKQALDMIFYGEITDSKTIIAIWAYKLMKESD